MTYIPQQLKKIKQKHIGLLNKQWNEKNFDFTSASPFCPQYCFICLKKST